jgi:hypothetical protein
LKICGDVDDNDSVTVTDGVQVLRAAAGLTSDCTEAICDVDVSGTIGVTDGVLVLRKAAGLPIAENCVPDNGVINNVYPLHCYGEAIKHVPNDLQQYTGIVDDITAARQRGARTLSGHNNPPPPSSATGNPNDPDQSVYNSAIDKLGPTNSDSIPLPLLILAGLALVMVAAGAAGLATRHLRARKTPA